jgi:hypothetical protein
MPPVSDEVEKLAVPPESVPLPMEAPPSLNVTVPVGVPAPAPKGETVAINVTDCPVTEGFTELVTVAALSDLFTVCKSGAEVPPVKLLSPAYVTVMVCVPTDSEVVVKLAVPLESVPLPIETPPSLNVTVPVGVPVPGAAALADTVNVTDWPNTDGLTLLLTESELPALLTVCKSVADELAVKLASPL